MLAQLSKLTDIRRGFVGEWVVTFIFLLFGTTSLLQAFVIPTSSMEGTLLIGDHVLVDKLTYSPQDPAAHHVLPYHDVRRGDIIVFTYPLDKTQQYVKRAIGLPGDHVRLENKRLILNGHGVDEPYAVHVPGIDPYRDNFPSYVSAGLRPQALDMLSKYVVNGELVVPTGYIFAMGDNRDVSDDSRYWGLVPRDYVTGTPLIIYWSFDAPTQDLINPNIGVDHITDVVTHFFSKTRWNRTFTMPHSYSLK